MLEERIPHVAINVFGTTVEPREHEWHTTEVWGLVNRSFSGENVHATARLGELNLNAAIADFNAPTGFYARYNLLLDNEVIAYGYMEHWSDQLNELFEMPGDYLLAISLEKPQNPQGRLHEHGLFEFRIHFTVPRPDPEIFTSRSTLQQGEVFAIRLENVPARVRPTAETVLGMSIFAPTGEGEWFVAVPIGNTRPPGTYTVNVTAGDFTWEKEVIVTEYDFQTQNLIIDTTNPVITQANSPAAFQQFRDRILPLFEMYDDVIHWQGTFLRPVEDGRISTPFGAIRFTNSNWANPRHHWGIDIAAPTGTPVIATNYGRVVLAEYLYNTGYTIVIEHGGGLKSLHYHLDTFYVTYNEMVQRGNLIGTVGSTGFSTGPHLHFEFRIGNQAVNPLMLIEETAPLYFRD